jgi:3'(2'), 5'-bisphosphate nucleotidase
VDVSSLWQELEVVLPPLVAGYRSKRNLHVEQKLDSTLLSEADIAVQGKIIECVRAFDPDALIVAEEDSHLQVPSRRANSDGRVWIIDPIDGTAQFVVGEGREFCSVVCLVEDGKPVAAFVLAPELGPDRSPVCVRLSGPDELVEINGQRVPGQPMSDRPQSVSVTRSPGTQARAYEAGLSARGYQLKTRTTSQTLDMVRTCVDLAPFTDPPLESFGLFYRERQKVWDGAAGMCFAYAAGLYVGDGAGRERTSIEIALDVADPQFDSTLIASDLVAARIVVEALSGDSH